MPSIKIFMAPEHVDNSIAKQLASNGLIQQKVKSDKDGVGYVSLFFAKGAHAVAYKGVACNLRNAKSGQYPGLRNFWMVTKGNKPKLRNPVHQVGPEQQCGEADRRDAVGPAPLGGMWHSRI